MNIFEPTPEQTRHWELMNDKALFRDVGRTQSDEKADARYKAAHTSAEVPRRLHYLRNEKKGDRKFYSLGGTAGTIREYGRGHDAPSNAFIGEVEEATFDDSDLVRMMISMQENLNAAPATREGGRDFASLQQDAERFIGGSIETKLGYGDKPEQAMQAHAASQLAFLQFLESLKTRLEFHKEVLSRHPLFKDLDTVIGQIDGIHAICRDSKLNTSSESGYIVAELPDAFKEMFPEGLHTLDTKTHNVFMAKALFLHKLGLVPHSKYLFTLGSLIDYVERAAKGDRAIKGVYPEIADANEDGLILDVEGFSHPAIYRGKPILKHFNDIYQTLGRDIFNTLEADGLVSMVETRDDRNYYWEQHATFEMIEQFIQKHKIKEGPAETLSSIFANSQFFPFQDIHLNARNRIQIVTGANFNGKSTYMQAVGYLFHRAATARKMIASSARISLPDMVFDDFDINAHRQYDISRERSTFSSQVGKIVEFMQRATPNSIGLFDELYHGTSAPYLLSLGWATIEEFERLGLYAIISTHEPLLTRFTEKDGYESLQGKYYRPPHSASSQRETAVGNVSLQAHYQLKHEPVIDSDAFRIARQEKMSEQVMARAQQILDHITGKPRNGK